MIEYTALETPIGPLHVFARSGAVVLIDLRNDLTGARAHLHRRFGDDDVLPASDPGGAASALARYFEGDLAALDRIQVDPGGTPFQASVWAALRAIPPSSTVSYQDLAQRIGAPRAVRAVGAANGANPVPIVVPCHRVIGASGKLVGYGGGLERKDWLLRHEGWRPLAR